MDFLKTINVISTLPMKVTPISASSPAILALAASPAVGQDRFAVENIANANGGHRLH